MNVLPLQRHRLYSFSESKFSETDNLPQVLKHEVVPKLKLNVAICSFLFVLGLLFIIIAETALPDGQGCSPNCTSDQKKQLGLLLLGILLTCGSFAVAVVFLSLHWFQHDQVQKKLLNLRNNYILSWRCDNDRWERYVDKEYGEDGRAIGNNTQQVIIILCCILFGSLLLSIKLKDAIDESYGRTFISLFGFCMVIYIPMHTIIFITNKCIRRYMKNNPQHYYVVIDHDSVYFVRLYWWGPPDHCCDGKLDLDRATLEKMDDGLILKYTYAIHSKQKTITELRVPVPDLLADQVNDVLEQIDKGEPNKTLTSQSPLQMPTSI